MLLLPVLRFSPASKPSATLFEPMVPFARAPEPSAVLFFPVVLPARAKAPSAVFSAPGVGLKSDQTVRRIVAAGRIELHRVQSAGRVRRATCVTQKDFKPNCDVVIADRIGLKRRRPDGGIILAAAVI
jgi:hypothetical protein